MRRSERDAGLILHRGEADDFRVFLHLADDLAGLGLGLGQLDAVHAAAQVHGVGRGAGEGGAARHPGLTASVPNGPELAIRAEHVTRDFGPVRALDALSLEIPKGIVFGFLGPNGAGKTTAIRVLLGLIDPSAGHAEVLGLDTRRHRPARLAVGVAISESPKALHHLDLLERAAELARYARTAGHGPIAFDRRSTPTP